MRSAPALIIVLLFIAGEGMLAHSLSPVAFSASEEQRDFDACSLLNNAEIEAVQGSSVKSTKASQRRGSSFLMPQCFYVTADFTKSVSLLVALHDPANRKTGPRSYWQQTLARAAREEADEKIESSPLSSATEAKQRAKKPRPVSGIGEEAFWVGDRVGGGLYVLLGNKFLRISVGGPGDESAKQQKSIVLGRHALKRLGWPPSKIPISP
ncbi:MAG TPA: hypothetical protein VGX03_22895 [Candidatus Binatia bacterium]|nr:hypothetical protein [Candidatus Binatia bacterium]